MGFRIFIDATLFNYNYILSSSLCEVLVHNLRCVKNIWFFHFKKNQVNAVPDIYFIRQMRNLISVLRLPPLYLPASAQVLDHCQSIRKGLWPSVSTPALYMIILILQHVFFQPILGYMLAAVGGNLGEKKTLHSPSTKYPMAGSQRTN